MRMKRNINQKNIIKKVVGIGAVVMFAMVCGSFVPDMNKVYAENSNIEINDNTFTDPIFMGFVKRYDEDRDGSLSKAERDAVTVLTIKKLNVEELTGIEYFTNLTHLDCSGNKLKSIDISRNIALTNIDCSNNQLRSLDVSNNIALEYIDCSNNQLQSLDVSSNEEITQLYCNNNQLQSLDLSHNAELWTLNCSENKLKSLDVSSNVNLGDLTCYDNDIDELIIDLNTLKIIQYIYCWNNKFRTIYLESLQNKADEQWPDNIVYYPKSNTITDQIAKQSYEAWGGSIKYDTNTKLLSFVKDISIDNTFPDTNFRSYISEEFDTNKDGVLSVAECDAVTDINVIKMGITDLSGIEWFDNLKELFCVGNELKALDVSNNVNLEKLYCWGNAIESLDISNNRELMELSCENNRLTGLDTSNNKELIHFYCYNNSIDNLDIGSNTKLQYFNAANNKLTALDVSSNSYIKEMNCSGNRIQTLDIRSNGLLETLNCDNNALETIDFGNISSLKIFTCNSNKLQSVEIGKNINLTYVECNDNQLKNLDVSKLTSLEVLRCNGNKLTELDISKNTVIGEFECADNQLKQLDVSNNEKLKHLYCYDNEITELTKGKLPAILAIYCWNNEFDRLQISLTNDNQDALMYFPPDVVLETYNRHRISYNSYTDKGGTITADADNEIIIFKTKSELEPKDSSEQTAQEPTPSDPKGDQPAGNVPASDSNGGQPESESDTPEGSGADTKLQTSITAKNFKKTFGNKAFSLGAKTNSDGVLQYSVDNKKVVSVSSKGKVTIKGCGKTNITITSPETAKYKVSVKKVTVTVLPGKLKLKKLSSPKRSRLNISWKKMQGASTYQYSISSSKSFKKAPTFSTKSIYAKKRADGASGRRFYVRVRAIVRINGKKYYGKWSNVKSIVVK